MFVRVCVSRRNGFQIYHKNSKQKWTRRRIKTFLKSWTETLPPHQTQVYLVTVPLPASCLRRDLYHFACNIKGMLILKDDNLRGMYHFCDKNSFSTLTTFLHERWLKSMQTFPVCSGSDVLFPSSSSVFFSFFHVFGAKRSSFKPHDDHQFLNFVNFLIVLCFFDT